VSLAETPPESPLPIDPPEASPYIRRVARRVLSPVERFLRVESASGVLLLVPALVALVWANSPWRDSYHAIWRASFGVRVAGHSFHRDLHFWINDGLMAVFFFVIGLEIRREIRGGELSDLRRAALPIVAAVGGMVFPALIYLALARGEGAIRGWGVPMATDIAFAVGVLTMLGRRVRPVLRTLLLTLAVVDDLGAVVVITVFYSSGIAVTGLLMATMGVAAVLVMQKLGVRAPIAYAAPALLVWAGLAATGIHPAIAGVAIGLLTPARAWYPTAAFVASASASLRAVRRLDGGSSGERALLPHVEAMNLVGRECVSPVERLEHGLHRWVAFVIMPLFAFANAGVSVGSASFRGGGLAALAGITAGLVIGKPLGIVLATWWATRLRLAVLPAGVRWRDVLVLGAVAGIGFTMSLFIGALAFPDARILETAKLAVLCGSVMAALLALGLARWFPRSPVAGAVRRGGDGAGSLAGARPTAQRQGHSPEDDGAADDQARGQALAQQQNGGDGGDDRDAELQDRGLGGGQAPQGAVPDGVAQAGAGGEEGQEQRQRQAEQEGAGVGRQRIGHALALQ
jgi:NhaA family Na+:H+ antiporter